MAFFHYYSPFDFSIFSKQYPNDYIDHIFMKITPLFIFGIGFLSWIRHIMFSKISCASPLEWNDCWDEYINKYCLFEEKYQFSMKNASNEIIGGINYYQWMPYFFLCLAGLASLPNAIWNILQSFYVIDINHIFFVTAFWNRTCKNTENALQYISTCFTNINKFTTKNQKPENIFADKSIFICYILIKILCFADSVLILYLLQIMIQEPSLLFGYDLVKDLFNQISWEESGVFPRVIKCNIGFGIFNEEIFETVQCVLPENAVYEKIAISIWFWIVLCWVLLVYSGIMWINFIYKVITGRYLENHLNYCWIEESVLQRLPVNYVNSSDLDIDKNRKLTLFKSRFMTMNNIFLLKLIEINFDENCMRQILLRLWNDFEE